MSQSEQKIVQYLNVPRQPGHPRGTPSTLLALDASHECGSGPAPTIRRRKASTPVSAWCAPADGRLGSCRSRSSTRSWCAAPELVEPAAGNAGGVRLPVVGRSLRGDGTAGGGRWYGSRPRTGATDGAAGAGVDRSIASRAARSPAAMPRVARSPRQRRRHACSAPNHVEQGSHLARFAVIELCDLGDVALGFDHERPDAQRPDAVLDAPMCRLVHRAARQRNRTRGEIAGKATSHGRNPRIAARGRFRREAKIGVKAPLGGALRRSMRPLPAFVTRALEVDLRDFRYTAPQRRHPLGRFPARPARTATGRRASTARGRTRRSPSPFDGSVRNWSPAGAAWRRTARPPRAPAGSPPQARPRRSGPGAAESRCAALAAPPVAAHTARVPARHELVLDRALDDQPGAEPRELRQRLTRILADPDGQQLIDLQLDLHRRPYRASHGVGPPSSSCQDLREPTPCPWPGDLQHLGDATSATGLPLLIPGDSDDGDSRRPARQEETSDPCLRRGSPSGSACGRGTEAVLDARWPTAQGNDRRAAPVMLRPRPSAPRASRTSACAARRTPASASDVTSAPPRGALGARMPGRRSARGRPPAAPAP
jgi:hypothetical protein